MNENRIIAIRKKARREAAKTIASNGNLVPRVSHLTARSRGW